MGFSCSHTAQDARYYDEEIPGANSTLVLRRVRPIIEAASGPFSFRIMSDFGEGRTVLQDAHVDVAFSKSVGLRAGKFKPPVGYERLLSATTIRFVERAFPTALVPNRDLGVQLGLTVYSCLGAGVFSSVMMARAPAPISTTARFAARHASRSRACRWARPPRKETSAHSATGVAAYKSPGQLDLFTYRTAATAAGTVLANGTHLATAPLS
jgi:phosphate-selective porin OprO/OprP